MIKNIDEYVSKVRKISSHDDDSIDRLNYVITTTILLVLSLLLFAKNYVGEPMQCWVPKQFTDIWENYAESYCFIENTYFVPMNETNLPDAETREDREMLYYQWVPFILVLMAFFFVVPRIIWTIFSGYSDLAMADLMRTAREASREIEKNADDIIDRVANTVNRKTAYGSANSRVKYGNSLFNTYIFVKGLIFVNVLGQFVFLNRFLGTAYTFWGLGVFWDMINGRHWQQSGHFPRVAFCDLNVRELGNVNHWTVQCVLMVNMFNEKIFIFLSFWYTAVLVATIANLVKWFVWRFSASSRRNFVAEVLREEDIDDVSKEEHFYENVLKDDGVLLLRLLDQNAGRIESAKLANKIWTLTYTGELISTPSSSA